MAEALALVGLVSAIVQFVDFSAKVIGRIDQFRSKNSEIPVAFRDISIQLPLLMSDLKQTKDRVELHEVALDTQSAVLALVQGCHANVIALDEILLKVLPEISDSSWRLAKKALLSVHQESKVQFIAQELRNNVIYLTHHSVTVTAQRDNDSKISFVQADEQMKMLQWLSITDPSIYHNRAIQQREPGTGQWLLQSEAFNRWRSRFRGLGWLHGIPGCEKTILCAAIIEAIKEHCTLSGSRVMAYYYIDFNDTSNASVGNILRSLIKQICVGTNKLPKVVQTLCSQHRASGQQPSIPTLISILQDLESTLAIQIFIIIDALDEYPELERPELLHTIQSLAGKDFKNTHIFTTSRAEHDIKFTIGESATDRICIENDQVDADIKLYVRTCLLEDPRLNKLPNRIKSMVELKLGEGAQGMFRWAVCQIDALRFCNKASAIKMALEDLPKSLYDTYERILSYISSTDITDARAIMQWIAFSKRPLVLEEVAEAATTQPGLEDIDPDDKLYDPHDVLRICRSLVSLSESKVIICGKLEVCQIVRFSHASVREYLLSQHITQGLAANFSLSEKRSHEQISQCCLSILLRNKLKHKAAPDPEAMPLLRYAAEFWFQHARERDRADEATVTRDLITEDFANRLFHTSITVFQNWLTIYDPNIKRGTSRLRGSGPSPLYYAALLGLVEPTRALLDLGYDVNAFGGRYGTALVAAASKGDERMVRLLVLRGADINCFGGLVFGNSLQAACYSGSESIVRLLLENGALVNTKIEGRKHDTALQVACEFGYENLVRLLIESGADINARGGGFGYALQAAAAKGHYAVSALLIEKGADVNAQAGHYGSALQGAVAISSERVTRLLLDAGADPNAQVGGFRDALRAAAWRQEQSIFDLLLERGADVNLSVQKLLDHGKFSTTSSDQELFDVIRVARVENSPKLMNLVYEAAKRISSIEHKVYTAKRAAYRRWIRPDRVRLLEKITQYVLKQDSDEYQEASIPSRWLSTTIE